MTLALENYSLRGANLCVAAQSLAGLKFSEEGHRVDPLPPEIAERGYFLDGEHATGQGDCVFYLFRILRTVALWPKEWNDTLPLELRQVRLKCGARFATLDDYPVIRQFLETNAVQWAGEVQDGDIVLMRWGNREGGAHHVALWAGEGFYHLPYGGVSGWQATDATWDARIVEVWRLNAVIQGEGT